MDGLTPRSVDQSKWYQEVVLKTELADYSPVKGCIVFRPYGYRIWELMQQQMDKMIKDAGVQNAYFPMLIPFSYLKKEAEHVEGFAPQVAVVTEAAGKKLEEPLVLRPTSETIIYSMFAKWIHSYRDLPLKLNQWANIVRWEMRTLPFLRTTEFLWQEGHTIHADKESATEEVMRALKMYEDFDKNCLSIYTIPGRKTESEKFPGAEFTYSVEAMMRDGKALQYGTSHLLSQKFAKSFEIQFSDKDGALQYPWMTSWGVSTRMIGGVIMAHGDDKGLVLPPMIAPIQVIVVPIFKTDADKKKIENFVKDKLADQLEDVRYEVDWSENTPGWKFSQWEMKGVPIRLEVGAKEIESGELTFCKRNTGEKGNVKVGVLEERIEKLLEQVQYEIYKSHKEFTEENTFEARDFNEFKKLIAEKKGFIKVAFKDNKDSEDMIKYETKATARNIPIASDAERGKCFFSGEEDAPTTIFARSY